ncbi:L-seryl-tRNA(Sec) selenium transferase [Pasteurella testudinis DSM 23072]|uniref:L-seryl-tRNA(Sec) selenium transferase n=1 Tax=Pasteurella testudinis DSM 23072 TaxID=1122938 RepID=A0A1W1V2C4_9PAST|nr:L-seryl-tRNA(Sec) selenium transferase [Pasteurella testudinis]SMB87475.1 L-seryl-tRNA(Sec) selenium transferase [Pasteurella testudinis DSM 23072]SUB50539.1 L-seryl-tRNA(Sec) selenium transferase [Pasteurella testudinis]
MNTLYRQLPSIDKILNSAQGELLTARFGRSAVVNQLRSLLQLARRQIAQQQQLPRYFSDFSILYKKLAHDLQQQRQVAIKKVHNLTGTVLHTNLGRALWGQAAQQAALVAMQENVALEFDLSQSKRSHRDQYISELLAPLCGAEAVCIVNNNAAAVLLLLATFAAGKEVIISRGELIEIGGAFRIPDIMQQAGCKLVEVGTTNRTRLTDYADNITENTALLMKVHSSNYQICGFTESVGEADLAQLARQHHLPLISDLGSGALIDLSAYGLPTEPTPQKMLADGVDLVSFSGDKLLGGPQAGIIVGKKEYIERLQQHPLKRALRCDKVILAGLEATLRDYLFSEKLTDSNPTLRLLTQDPEHLQTLAEPLLRKLQEKLGADYALRIETSSAQIGSGSQPMYRIPSLAVTLQPHSAKNADLMQLIRSLKQLSQPIIGRIEQQKLWLDLRSVANPQQLLTTLDEL